jgi:hypothetical protein
VGQPTTQIFRLFCQVFPKILFAVLWDFKGLQGPQERFFRFQTF